MSALRPFYFTVVFWGEEHRAYFTDLLLASLLSPNNIPALNKHRNSKFLIVTTRQDWEQLQSHTLFLRLRDYIEPVFFEMAFPTKHDSKMLIMSQGHKQVAMRAYEDKAYGVFVTPDLILSDGSVAAMERLAEQGKKVVLCVAIRFAQETLLAAMKTEGFYAARKPLEISSRDLMRLALAHLHTETLRYEFDASYFADTPISVYWWASKAEAMIIYSFSWAPLVVDYGALHRHDTKTFEKWTLDGDYIYRNFPEANDVYVITDSDEISLVSFTKESELHFELTPDKRMEDYGIFNQVYKVSLMRSLKDSDVMDPLKREIFSQPVMLHSTQMREEWGRTIEMANSFITQACRSPTLQEQFMMDVVEQSASSKFSQRVLNDLQDCSQQDVFRLSRGRYFFLWLCVIRPRRWLLKTGHGIGQFTGYYRVYWIWRYRRFVWWRLKEKLGLVEERGFDWQQGGWEAPGVSPVCPVFTIKWIYRYRRFVWWRLKEKLGLVKERGFDWQQGGWEAPGVSPVCPLFTVRWMWNNRRMLWKEKRNFLRVLKNKESTGLEVDEHHIVCNSSQHNEGKLEAKFGVPQTPISVSFVESNTTSRLRTTKSASSVTKETNVYDR
ncbi:MAG: hypothetical protein MRJ96_11700 [Nitrospirales bacterium]|nr:hypothetical protein [Nitrospira sp.]MDR4502104.1 hypothetical protein [Nitrospirales bacterium]